MQQNRDSLPRILEEWEKIGPKILKSLAGIAALLITAFLSNSTSSDRPSRSNRIHSFAPPAFFLALVIEPPPLLWFAGEPAPSIACCGSSATFLWRRRLPGRPREKGPLPIILYGIRRKIKCNSNEETQIES